MKLNGAAVTFKAVITGTMVKLVDTKEEGRVISTDPECRTSLVAEDGNPHELADRLGALHGKRVHVQIALEQPDLGFGEDETAPSRAMAEPATDE